MKTRIANTEYNVCPINDHMHNTGGVDFNCPGRVGMGSILLDAYESAGSHPIFYYTSLPLWDTEKPYWDQPSPFMLYRYDSGSNRRETLAEFTK